MAETMPVPVDNWREDRKALDALIQRAKDGDKAVLPAMRKMLEERPDVWRNFGDFAEQARNVVLKSARAEDPLTQACTRKYLDSLILELAGEQPTKLERLTAERVALCQLQLSMCEANYWVTWRGGKATNKTMELLQKNLERAQNQYLKAVKTLALIRRLKVPVVLNLADKQINLIGGDTHGHSA